MLETGATAPDFTLPGAQGEEIREFTLSELADNRPAMLVFYVHDFSPVCSTQMCEIDDMEMLTFNDDVAVLGISTDGPYSHQQFIAQNDISYPLLTDVDKTVYAQFGMVEPTGGGTQRTKRGIVLLDADRTVQYRWEAEENWDEWDTSPLYEAYDIIEELTDTTEP